MKAVILVALGGALGAVLRYGTNVFIVAMWQRPLPLATWIVNIAGCLFIGLLMPIFARPGGHQTTQLFLVIGFLGSLTTFSTYSLETLILWEDGKALAAMVNALGSVAAGLAAVALGTYVGRMLFPV